MQRSYTKLINGCEDLNYYSRLKKLKLMSLQRRRERYIIIYTWKLLHNKVPNDFDITFYVTARHGWKAKCPVTPKNSPKYVETIYENSFERKAVKLWNILPLEVNTSKTLERLKINLGKFLSTFPDEPPSQGTTVPAKISSNLVHRAVIAAEAKSKSK